MTKRNILAGWAKAGLFPFNPARVLRDLQLHSLKKTQQMTRIVVVDMRPLFQRQVSQMKLNQVRLSYQLEQHGPAKCQ
jgi:hypothetical protein